MTIFAWILVSLTLIAGYGWSSRLLHEQTWLTLLLGFAFSVGALTLIMLWEGLLGIPFTLLSILLPYTVLLLPGWWHIKLSLPHLPTGWANRFMLLILLALSAAILFNGAYWPFYRDDTLGIYQPAAEAIYQTQTLVPLTGATSLYRAYPVLVPLEYSYAYLASGWENDYLAKVIATLLSLACLPAAYLLGQRWRNQRVGWLAALMLALTPFFSRWASSGYVDLPMAFFYTLAAVFALRLWESQKLLDALLAGLLIGLAAWTKNAALIGVLLLAFWLIWCRLNQRLSNRAVAASLITCALVAAPWYIRNLIGAGFLIPATAWTDQAQRTLSNLFVLITHPENFGLPGWIMLGGAIVAIPAALRRQSAPLLLLLWTLPFFAAWWLFVSYDPRFLLLFMPLLCVLGADLLARLWDWLGSARQPRARAVLVILTLLLAVPILLGSVDYKGSILHHPLMSDSDKRALVGRK